MNLFIILSLLKMLRGVRKREGWTKRELEEHQSSALRHLREYVYAHSPFYRKFHKGLFDAPMGELPVLTKTMLMENFDELVTDRSIRLEEVKRHVTIAKGGDRFLGRYWVTATSGSTGRPGLFLYNRTEWVTVLSSFARAYEWAGFRARLTRRRKMAMVASTSPWHMSSMVGATLRSSWMPALRLSASEPVEAVVERLNAWLPEILVAYPSVARILADEQCAGRLRICPEIVFTSAEVLTDETRRRVELAWGKQPFNQYAVTETGGLAAECGRHGGLHIFEDTVFTEIVDGDNRPVPPGAYGEKLLVTVLFNRTQPLIRYELSDSVRAAAGPCPCGLQYAFIDGIQGRKEEVLYFPSPKGGKVAVHPIVFHRLLDSVPVGGWQVVRDTEGLKILLCGAHEGFSDERLEEEVRRALSAQGAVMPPVKVVRVKAIPQTASGKAPLIKSNVALPGPPI